MNDQTDEMKKYYSDGAWAELSKRREQSTERLADMAMEGTRKWQALFKDIGQSLDSDPAGPTAQALFDRWQALIEEFTGGSPEIRAGIARAWQDRDSWSEERKTQAAPFADPRVWEFIRKAGAVRTS